LLKICTENKIIDSSALKLDETNNRADQIVYTASAVTENLTPTVEPSAPPEPEQESKIGGKTRNHNKIKKGKKTKKIKLYI
jgi:hypothetical protein